MQYTGRHHRLAAVLSRGQHGAMQITTWNVNSLNVRLPHVLRYIEAYQPDILALQETKLPDEKFPCAEIEAAGYHVCFSGQKTYNGVAILSRARTGNIMAGIPDLDDPQRRMLATTVNGIRIINVYIPNGQEVDSEKYQYKFRWLTGFERFLQRELKVNDRLIVLGDFNIAPADIDVYNPKRWHGKIMCSDAERSGFCKLLEMGLVDTVRSLHPDEGMYSWWDYRLNAFSRGWGLRIDHVLATSTLKPAAAGVHVDERGRERPSDHAPVWVKFS